MEISLREMKMEMKERDLWVLRGKISFSSLYMLDETSLLKKKKHTHLKNYVFSLLKKCY